MGKVVADPEVVVATQLPARVSLRDDFKGVPRRRCGSGVDERSGRLSEGANQGEDEDDEDQRGCNHHETAPDPTGTAHHPGVPSRRHTSGCEDCNEADPENNCNYNPGPIVRGP